MVIVFFFIIIVIIIIIIIIISLLLIIGTHAPLMVVAPMTAMLRNNLESMAISGVVRLDRSA